MLVVITIPAYNEERTIGKVIQSIQKTMDNINQNYKILVIDDGSKDNTKNISLKHGAKVFSHPINYGLVKTFRTEMKKVLELNPDIIVHIDADGQYRAADIPRLIQPIINKKADIVLGSRFKGKIESMPLIKWLGNIAFSKVISNIANIKISDGQTGFRAFTKEVAALQIKSDHTYTQEQIIRAVREKFRLLEIPVYFGKRSDKSRLIKNPFEYATKAWINILRIYRDYEPLRFFGYFGSFFIIIGLLFSVWIIITLYNTGSVGGIPRVILSGLFFTTGIQIMLFGFLADMKRE